MVLRRVLRRTPKHVRFHDRLDSRTLKTLYGSGLVEVPMVLPCKRYTGSQLDPYWQIF